MRAAALCECAQPCGRWEVLGGTDTCCCVVRVCATRVLISWVVLLVRLRMGVSATTYICKTHRTGGGGQQLQLAPPPPPPTPRAPPTPIARPQPPSRAARPSPSPHPSQSLEALIVSYPVIEVSLRTSARHLRNVQDVFYHAVGVTLGGDWVGLGGTVGVYATAWWV